LGIEHILSGYDHLLFLFGLLIGVPQFRQAFIVLTAFTIAHSFTLILATLGAVQVSSRVIEPLIAATIVSVGLENLFVRDEKLRLRWVIAFAFGLVHGFGFASVLSDLAIGLRGSRLVWPLLTFNLGVEIGQIFVASLAFPLLSWLRSKPAVTRWGVPALSWLVMLTGIYWLFERTLLA
jgi:hydrogenase/urease accessory protein HupE